MDLQNVHYENIGDFVMKILCVLQLYSKNPISNFLNNQINKCVIAGCRQYRHLPTFL